MYVIYIYIYIYIYCPSPEVLDSQCGTIITKAGRSRIRLSPLRGCGMRGKASSGTGRRCREGERCHQMACTRLEPAIADTRAKEGEPETRRKRSQRKFGGFLSGSPSPWAHKTSGVHFGRRGQARSAFLAEEKQACRSPCPVVLCPPSRTSEGELRPFLY